MRTIGYVRVSTDKQMTSNQRNEILNYAQARALLVSEFIDVTLSSRKDTVSRRIDELIDKVSKGDIILVSELSRLGRSTQEVLATIDSLMCAMAELHIIKQGLVINPNNKNDFTSKAMVTLLGLFSELERDLISQRTKEALRARKAAGVALGKPKGTIQASKYDAHRERIVELYRLGLSLNKIIDIHLKPTMSSCSVASLSKYLKSRGLV
nr:recombinase family protein [uncultured Campylobacter sp.]